MRGSIFDAKEKRQFKIPGLLFADDLVLMSHNYDDMETLLKITSDFGDERNLVFNPDKSAIVVYSRFGLGLERPMSIQGKQLPEAKHYKYLGITLSRDVNYLRLFEEDLEQKGIDGVRKLQAQIKWTCNRFLMTRIQWKATAVPALTYGNSAITINAGVREKLEARQRDAARWALGISGYKVAKPFLQAELGFSSFEKEKLRAKSDTSAESQQCQTIDGLRQCLR